MQSTRSASSSPLRTSTTRCACATSRWGPPLVTAAPPATAAGRCFTPPLQCGFVQRPPAAAATRARAHTAENNTCPPSAPAPRPPPPARAPLQPLYGFGSRDKSRFVRAAGHPDVYYLADPERPIGQVRRSGRSDQGRAAAALTSVHALRELERPTERLGGAQL